MSEPTVDYLKIAVDALFDTRHDEDLIHYANRKLKNHALCGVDVEPIPGGEASSGSSLRRCLVCERLVHVWTELDWSSQRTVDFIEGRE